MIRPSDRQAKALAALQGSIDIVEFIRASLEDTRNRLVMQQDAEVIRVLQGEARTWQALLDCITEDITQQSGKR